jgi:hypothetical protein
VGDAHPTWLIAEAELRQKDPFPSRSLGTSEKIKGLFMKKQITFIIMVMLTAIWGCVSYTATHYPAKTEFGKPIDIAKYEQVVEGKTTESDVIELLGEPTRVMERSGSKVLQYSHFQTQTYGSIGSPAGLTGASSHSMLMFNVINGVVIKKAKIAGSQPVEMKPGTTLITPSKEE